MCRISVLTLKNAHSYYLPTELSIRKLWKMYKNSFGKGMQVKESFFRLLFTRNYNVVLGTPITDICSTSLQFREKITPYTLLLSNGCTQVVTFSFGRKI